MLLQKKKIKDIYFSFIFLEKRKKISKREEQSNRVEKGEACEGEKKKRERGA